MSDTPPKGPRVQLATLGRALRALKIAKAHVPRDTEDREDVEAVILEVENAMGGRAYGIGDHLGGLLDGDVPAGLTKVQDKEAWFVWTKHGRAPRYAHSQRDHAIDEALRLARLHPDWSFLILHAVKRLRFEPEAPAEIARSEAP